MVPLKHTWIRRTNMCELESIVKHSLRGTLYSSSNGSQGFTLSQLTKLFNQYRKKHSIRCANELDWRQKRDHWTRLHYTPSHDVIDEHGTGRSQSIFIPKGWFYLSTLKPPYGGFLFGHYFSRTFCSQSSWFLYRYVSQYQGLHPLQWWGQPPR